MDYIGWEELEVYDDLLQECLEKVKDDKQRGQPINPPLGKIFRAFSLTKMKDVKVVIVGMDPYHTPGVANGLAFSANRNQRIPPSLRNIYKCLLARGVINDMPDHPDLTAWAKRGILLINAQLTTTNKSDQHKFWRQWTGKVVDVIAAVMKPHFMLFGRNAQTFCKDIEKYYSPDDETKVFKYRHPSPLANRNGPWLCPYFDEINIDWEPYFYEHVFVATDGASLGNHDKSILSRGGVGVHFPDKVTMDIGGETRTFDNYIKGDICQKVEPRKNKNGELVGCSSYRAELLAIYSAFTKIMAKRPPSCSRLKIVLVSDNMVICKMFQSGMDTRDGVSADVRNAIAKSMKIFPHKLIIIHVNSHQKGINDFPEMMRTFYQMNEKADELAGNAALF